MKRSESFGQGRRSISRVNSGGASRRSSVTTSSKLPSSRSNDGMFQRDQAPRNIANSVEQFRTPAALSSQSFLDLLQHYSGLDSSDDIQTLQADLVLASQIGQSLLTQNQEFHEIVAKVFQSQCDIERERDELLVQVEVLRASLAQATKERDALESQCERQQRDLDDAHGRTEQMEHRIRSLGFDEKEKGKGNFLALRQQLDEAAESASALQTETESLRTQLKQSATERQAAETRIRSLYQDLDSLQELHEHLKQSQIAQAAEWKAKLESLKTDHKQQLESIIQQSHQVQPHSPRRGRHNEPLLMVDRSCETDPQESFAQAEAVLNSPDSTKPDPIKQIAGALQSDLAAWKAAAEAYEGDKTQ
ncbi:uncharacterized protein BJ171DRAFT_568253, partial [Polychytrium aggregatum]|uniref:uncharacterized protein n=1 Tax=Polychytrium aggregatum TaxID=110093 RepID=UPI0022FE93A7